MRKVNFKNIITLILFSIMMFSTLPVFAQDKSDVVATEEMITSDILYSSGNLEKDKEVDRIVNKLRAFIKKNPNATDFELNAFVKNLMFENNTNKGEFTTLVYTDMDGYITGLLNPLEQELYNSNTAKALLCMANGKLAVGYAEDNYISSVLHNGNGDAFRHCLWNYGMGIDVGQTFAKQWSDAHENGTPNNPAIEKSMDLFNNSVGLKLALDNPYTILHGTFISKSKEKCRNGLLKIISNGVLVKSTSAGEK